MINQGQRKLSLIFTVTAIVLLIILYALGRVIWMSYDGLIKELADKDNKLEKVFSSISHDLRSPLVALQMLQHSIQDQPENIRIMFLKTVNQIHDIANDLVHPKEQESLGPRKDRKRGH